tara:strand:- start:10702 stop:11667 length:966 start_codon:yes stop_codon:yes gene_type:complete
MTMTVQHYDIKFKPFNHHLSYPIKVNGTQISLRKGFYCYILIKDNVMGVGEIAPLPGLSKETLDDVKEELSKLTAIKLPLKPSPFEQRYFPIFSKLPSVQFGIESAIVMALSSPSTLKCHQFIGSLQTAPTSYPSPIIKFKIGRAPMQDELNLIKRILKQNNNIKFRFDANHNLSLSDAKTFFKDVPNHHIDYIEAPCKTHQEEILFERESKLPIAIDTPDDITSIPAYCQHLIIKPMIIGSVFTYLNRIPKHVTCIFSSSYESIIGLTGITNIASYISPEHYHGLNTNHIFKHAPKNQSSYLKALSLTESLDWINTYGPS